MNQLPWAPTVYLGHRLALSPSVYPPIPGAEAGARTQLELGVCRQGGGSYEGPPLPLRPLWGSAQGSHGQGVQGSGLRAPGSGLRRQDTDHRVGKPHLWPLRVKAWLDLGCSPSLTPSVLRESLLFCLQPLQGHCGWALPSGSSQLYCPHIRDVETEDHDPPKVTEH